VFRLAYNTNGLAHHRLLDALRLLADLGYEGVAITPDVGQLDPLDLDRRLVDDVRRWSDELGLDLSLETGARFLLDPRRKHFPSLLERDAADRARRVDFLCRTVDLAAELGADPVSLWAGNAPDGATAESGTAPEACWTHLVDGLRAVLDHAGERGVSLAFEPEPGMFVERPAGFRALRAHLGGAGEELGLCLDVGHLLCTGDLPAGATIRAHAEELVLVHLDDVKDGVHEHRMFGEGDLDLRDVLRALLEVGFQGQAAVELSRDSHRGPAAAREALVHLRAALGSLGQA